LLPYVAVDKLPLLEYTYGALQEGRSRFQTQNRSLQGSGTIQGHLNATEPIRTHSQCFALPIPSGYLITRYCVLYDLCSLGPPFSRRAIVFRWLLLSVLETVETRASTKCQEREKWESRLVHNPGFIHPIHHSD